MSNNCGKRKFDDDSNEENDTLIRCNKRKCISSSSVTDVDSLTTGKH